jgi:ketosteroid isomerase-like protein
MKKLLLMTFLSSTILVACNGKTETKSALDTVTAQKLVDEGNRAFEGYVSKGDSVGLATNSYTIDAKFMAPNMATAEGRPAVTTAVAGIINSGITGIKLTSKELWVNENTITETGSFDLNIKDGTVVEKGKYLVVWKQEDGKWKIHRDMFNSDLPVMPVAAK